MKARIAEIATTDMSIRYLLLHQIRALEDAGHEVTAICAPGPRVAALESAGLRVRTVGFVRELSPGRDLGALVELVRLFKRESYDAVITHTPKAGLIAPLAAQIAGVPLVIHTVHGLLFHDRMRAPRRLAGMMYEGLTAAFSDRLFFQSADDLEWARRLRPKAAERLFYIGNGVDTREFRPQAANGSSIRASLGLRGDAFVVGTVGRLVWEKGYAELFDAAHALSTRHRDVVFVVVGPLEDDQRDALSRGDVARLSAFPYIRFLGHRDDMPALYGAMDLFALPSHREGIPRALMEASASGLPVVASDIRGCREVVVDGVTGLLFPMGDARALAQRVEAIHRDPERGAAMGQAGREHVVENFEEAVSAARVAAKLEELLPSVWRGSQRERVDGAR